MADLDRVSGYPVIGVNPVGDRVMRQTEAVDLQQSQDGLPGGWPEVVAPCDADWIPTVSHERQRLIAREREVQRLD